MFLPKNLIRLWKHPGARVPENACRREINYETDGKISRSEAGSLFCMYLDYGDGIVRYRQIVVHENETIWTIAEENCPSGTDPRIHVKEICEINDVNPGEIQPGDVLIVPVEV